MPAPHRLARAMIPLRPSVASCSVALTLFIVAFAHWAGAAGAAEDRQYPSRPVRVLVGVPAGSGIDTVTRALALQLGQQWGRGMIIDNRPGAGGAIAFDIVARAPADGHTLLGASVGLVATSRVLKKVTFDPLVAFEPVIEMTAQPYIVIAYPGAPFRSIQELIAYARAHPGKINYASSGAGSASHLGTELFKSMTGISLIRVSYKGLPPALNDLVAGQVHVLFGTVLSAAPFIKAGRVTAIAVTTRQRLSAYPGLPTVAESGVPGFELTTAYGLYAPAGTSRAVQARINKDVRATLDLPEMRARLAADGADIAAANTPAEFKASFAREVGRWEALVRSSGADRDELLGTP